MKIQIGAGSRSLPGFVNIEPRPVGPHAQRGHACDLNFAGDRSVDVLFSHAVFEHLYLGQQALALREWSRVLSGDGAVVCLGIPDFEAIARLYLAGAAPGNVSATFDLFEVYRYTHGNPEQDAPVDWARWSPRRQLNRAPRGWLPQLHKAIFDRPTVAALFESAGLSAVLFRYRYPNEMYAVNLGVVAGHTLPELRPALAGIPNIEQFIDLESLSSLDRSGETELSRRAEALADLRVGSLRHFARSVRTRYGVAREQIRRN